MSTGKRFSTVKRVIVVLLPVMVCYTGVGGCTYIRNFNLTTLRTKAAEAYTSGLAAIMRESVSSVDEIWVLREILKLTQDEALQQFVNDKAASLGGDSFLRLIDPNVSRVDLPADPCSGFTRFYSYVLAPLGRPEKRAISFINDFLATEESGYILTHQFLVLEWAEQTGLELPKQLEAKKPKILERILQEQLTDDSFSDLYAERAAILLRFGDQKPSNAAQWVEIIVNAQLEDGSWGLYSENLTFDGESTTGEPGASHTIVLALLSLRAYLDKY
ncbi:hypothetical protein ES703_17839 [subsurface metagenome]